MDCASHAGPAPVPPTGAPVRSPGYLFDDALYRALRALGLSVSIEFDIDAWKDFI